MKRVIAMILAGGQGDRLSVLSEERAKPAVPFGGRYRIIDFTLSNCANSEIRNVGVLTQYRPRSLNDHIGIGGPWDLDRGGGAPIREAVPRRDDQPTRGRGFAPPWTRRRRRRRTRDSGQIRCTPAR